MGDVGGSIVIRRGYRPGAIGRIVELHGAYYHDHWGFDQRFEAEVAVELGEFVARMGCRDGLWLALAGDEIVGSIAVDGSRDVGGCARLRWFIVAPCWQGRGIGSELLQEALAFCRASELQWVYLWTFAGLEAARRIYERFGFVLREERTDDAWGTEVTHQMFVLRLES